MSHHPLLTSEALQARAEQARKALCNAGDLLIGLHQRAGMRFHGGRTEAELQALAELSALANHAVAMLARFDRETVPALEKALAGNNS